MSQRREGAAHSPPGGIGGGDEWHLPACKLDSDIWILEDSLDSVVLETFQGVDKGCEHADIFAIWILDSGVYRMHNPAKALADSAFVTFAHWGRSLDSGFGFCDLHDHDHAQSRKNGCILYSVFSRNDYNRVPLGPFPGFWIWILRSAG